tara:strand:+ start:376 stop:732 length:357 start_codon:yes stop_codon:yes gene_type:complete
MKNKTKLKKREYKFCKTAVKKIGALISLYDNAEVNCYYYDTFAFIQVEKIGVGADEMERFRSQNVNPVYGQLNPLNMNAEKLSNDFFADACENGKAVKVRCYINEITQGFGKRFLVQY